MKREHSLPLCSTEPYTTVLAANAKPYQDVRIKVKGFTSTCLHTSAFFPRGIGFSPLRNFTCPPGQLPTWAILKSLTQNSIDRCS